ncbi:hypothetical protein MASR2M69_02930 [Bacteroidota bacterium]
MSNAMKDTLLIGDQAVLRFKTKIAKGERFVFPTPQNPVMEKLEVIGVPKTDTLSDKNGVLELESRITVTSFDSGSYNLPKFTAYKVKADGTTDTLSFDGGQT